VKELQETTVTFGRLSTFDNLCFNLRPEHLVSQKNAGIDKLIKISKRKIKFGAIHGNVS